MICLLFVLFIFMPTRFNYKKLNTKTFLSFKVFGLFSSCILLYSQYFDLFVLWPSSIFSSGTYTEQ